MSHSDSIIFVDDEPRIVNALRRMLRPMRNEWDMSFMTSGTDVLDAMDDKPFDAIVSDIRMPGMDGVDLLTVVRARHPGTVRIALSGQASKLTVLNSVGLVHQYLAKPCEPDIVKATLNRVFRLRKFVPDKELRQRLSSITSLPSLPALYRKFQEQIQLPEPSISELGQIISRDVGMSTRILQLVGSAFFGKPCRPIDPGKATVFLGLDIVKTLGGSELAFSQFSQETVESFPIDSLWRHSRNVAQCEGAIAKAENAKDDAVSYAHIAGLLHDVGKAFFALEFPNKYAPVASGGIRDASFATESERRLFQTTHAETGAYLLGLWGLADPVVEAVAFHHTPQVSRDETFSALTAVHAANALVGEIAPEEQEDWSSSIDEDYLTELGLIDHLHQWREACRNAMKKETVNA